MNTSTFEEKQKEYVNLAREEVLVQKRAMIMGGMGAMTMDGMGGMATMGGMGDFGATMGGMRGMGGFEATMGGMRGMIFAFLTGGMGAPPMDMGERMSSGVPHILSHDAVEDLANTFRAPHDDGARDNEEEEEETSSGEKEESE
ncbi:hypothetical protein ZWY2020_021612 [Hordeum vulgare]|nr:hypothetical protein ZWY2020_021612 [Hordeum vulgare]